MTVPARPSPASRTRTTRRPPIMLMAVASSSSRLWSSRPSQATRNGSSFAPAHGAATELWVSDGRGTERVPVEPVDAYRVMVDEVSSALIGGPGWLLPLEESRLTASVLDAAFASCADGGAPRRPS